MQVNLGGTFFLAQTAANQMKQQASGGSLLFTSSVTGHQAHKDLAAYGMSKAAIEMLAENLVIELITVRINVNTIAPGATLTERTLDDPQYESTWSKLTPMGRPAKVNDIAMLRSSWYPRTPGISQARTLWLMEDGHVSVLRLISLLRLTPHPL